jgi:signal transduction histidine kinase
VSLEADAERLRRLQLVTDAALAHLRLDELLAALLERTRDVLEVDTCAVLLLDEAGEELVARAAVGLEEEVQQGVRIPLGRGFAGRIAAERRPIVIRELAEAEVVNPLLREKGLRSLMGVPLIVQKRTIGVLHVGTLVPRVFDDGDVEFLQLVADRAAIAIDHARLYESEREARVRVENVQSVTDAALATLALDELLGELLQRIRQILDADTCAILLVDERRKVLVARAAAGLEEEVERGVRIPIGRGFAGRVAAERRPVVLEDVAHADVLNPLLREKGIKSLLGAPLVARDDVIGVVHVGTLTPRKFTQQDIDLLQLAAERAGLAIERARVYDEIVRLDQLKVDFVAIASHELRTPAASVYGIAATLLQRDDELSTEQRKEFVQILWEQSERLRLLIEQLLDMSRLDSHAIALDPRQLRVRDVVDEVVAAVAANRADDVLVAVADDLDAIVDPVALDRVLSNLLVNALRHGAPPVVVSADRTDRHLRVAVEDEGGGIAPEVVPRLFDRFERGEEGHGSGLGLAIARAYARAHGGDLLYDPRERGARFELVLPG